jgi:hypothetical protein
MTERLLVTIHDSIPADAFPAVERLCRKLRRSSDGEVMVRQIGGYPAFGQPYDGPPRFELFVSTGDEETTHG